MNTTITTDVLTVSVLVAGVALIMMGVFFYFGNRIRKLKNQDGVINELGATNLKLIDQVHRYQNFLRASDTVDQEINGIKYWFKPIEAGPFLVLRLHDQIKPRPAAAFLSLIQGVEGLLIEGFHANDTEQGKFLVSKLIRLKSGHKVTLSQDLAPESIDLFMQCNGRLVVAEAGNDHKTDR